MYYIFFSLKQRSKQPTAVLDLQNWKYRKLVLLGFIWDSAAINAEQLFV